MNEKLYCIRCRTGYAVLGEAPPKMDETAMYRLLGESMAIPHRKVGAILPEVI